MAKAKKPAAPAQPNAAAATRAFKSGTRKLPDHYLVCRDIRHDWEITENFHVVPFRWVGRKVEAVKRVLGCERCTAVRTQIFLNGRYGLSKVSDSTVLPKDYTIPGIPRGVKVLSIVQQENYRRAVERATGAKPGDKARER